MIAYINNGFIKAENAMLHVGDLAIQRGYAAFDFLRVLDNKPLFIDDYIDRFFRSAATMRLHHSYSKLKIKEIILQVIKQNNLAVSGLRMILTGGYSPDSYQPVLPNLIITQHPLILPDAKKFSSGIKVITHNYQRSLPCVKSINYLVGIWMLAKMKEQEADDILYHTNDVVTEFPRANIFMVNTTGELITNEKNILEGITRKKVLEFAKNKYPIIIKDFSVDEIKQAAEIFMTSTTKRILPVSQVDDAIIGAGKAGPVTIRLQNDFLAIEAAEIKK